MPDLRDAFRIATDHAVPEPGALERQLRHQRRRSARRKAGAFVAVAAVLALLAGVILATRPGSGEREDRLANPAPQPHGLFALDVGTGALTPFHDPDLNTRMFEMSPDGSQLLMTHVDPLTHRSELWVANADGTDPAVLVSDDAQWGTWFPDGQRIAYAGLGDGDGDDTRQIQVLDLRTGEIRQVTDEPLDVFDPEVTPDGSAIIYATTRPSVTEPVGTSSANAPGPPPVGLLRRVEIGSGATTTLFREAAGWVYLPSVSPDTGEIAFGRRQNEYPSNDTREMEIVVIGPGGGARVFLARDLAAGRAYVDAPLWSPDGSQLAYMIEDTNGDKTVWVHDVATGVDRPVGPGWPETWLDGDTLLVGT